MLAAPVPFNEGERLAYVRGANCAYSPREERFDRVTRTAKRLLHVPIALISIIEQDELWLRSVQGLNVDHLPRDISFCGHVVAHGTPLCIIDTLKDKNFWDNPLVTGPPGIRSYLGWPLEISPGIVAGTLCVIDTVPRMFGDEERDALRDLAGMVESELKVKAMSSLQGKMMLRLNALQRRAALDPLTGCWNIRGFRELLAISMEDARENATELAVCSIHIDDLEQVAEAASVSNRDALTQMLAQVLRQRLPQGGALARLGPSDFCALVPAKSALALEGELARLTFPKATIDLPDSKLRVDISISVRVSWLAEIGPDATPATLWAHALIVPA